MVLRVSCVKAVAVCDVLKEVANTGKMALARQMFAAQSHSIPEICAALGVSRATFYRYVKEALPPT